MQYYLWIGDRFYVQKDPDWQALRTELARLRECGASPVQLLPEVYHVEDRMAMLKT